MRGYAQVKRPVKLLCWPTFGMRTSVWRLQIVPAFGLFGSVGLAAVAWWLYGAGWLGYDAGFGLVGGQALTHGDWPARGAAYPPLPTGHPLVYLGTVPLALLGNEGVALFQAIVFLGFGAIGVASFEIGRRLFNVYVGAAFSFVLLTRPSLIALLHEGSTDLVFLAVLLCAGARLIASPTRPGVVMALIATAGLLRPEAWVFAGLYLLAGWTR
jgi:hypothetical protein